MLSPYLPLMAGVPMPVTHHTLSPYHSTGKQASLGVLELVPVGGPVTWYHCMVMCAKKNGKPRQTVDFQMLNFHATLETHHKQSPFHQACSLAGGIKKTIFDCWNGYHSILPTSPHSLPHRGNTNMKKQPRDV